MAEKMKLGILPIAKHNQYQADLIRFMDCAKSIYTDSSVEVLMPNRILLDQDEILAYIREMEGQQVSMLLVVVGSWIYSSLVVSAVNDTTLPFALYGVSDVIANGNLGASLQIKYVLEEMGKRFHYFAGKVDDKLNHEQILKLVKAAWVRQQLRNRSIATIGGKCMMMYQTQVNEFDWKRVFGIDFPQYDTVQVFHEMKNVDEGEADRLAQEFLAGCRKINWSLPSGETIQKDAILSQAKMFLAFKRLKELYHVDIFANKCMPEMVSEVYGYNYGACVATCMLNAAGITTACEADVPAALSMYIMTLISGDKAFFADIAKLNTQAKRVTFFNCGTAPTSMADPAHGVSLWPIPKLVADEAVPYEYCTSRMGGACIHFDLENGRTITLLRVGGNGDNIRLHVCRATTVPREVAEGEEQGIRWPGFGMELHNGTEPFLQHVTGHHYAICYGDWAKELEYLAKLLNIGFVFDE
jgi:L-fucose isomerase-like protein